MSTYGDMPDYLEELDEDECLNVFNQMRHKWGWSGTFFTRKDVESHWDESAEFDDDAFDEVTRTYEWRHLEDRLCESGWDMVDSAISTVISNREGSGQ